MKVQMIYVNKNVTTWGYYDIEMMKTKVACEEFAKFKDYLSYRQGKFQVSMKWIEAQSVDKEGYFGSPFCFPEVILKEENLLGYYDEKLAVTWHPDDEGFREGLLCLYEIEDGKRKVLKTRLTSDQVISEINNEVEKR